MSNKVEAVLQLTNAPFKTGLEQAKRDLAAFKKDAHIDVVGDVITGVAEAENPLKAISSALETISSKFKIAGLAAVGFAAGLAIKEKLEAVAKEVGALLEKFNDLSSVNFSQSTVEQLDAIREKALDIQKEAGKAGWFQKWLFGEGIKAAELGAQEMATRALSLADKKAAERVRLENSQLAATTPDQKLGADQALINNEYQEKINQALQQGKRELAAQLEIQRKLKLEAGVTEVEQKKLADNLKEAQEYEDKIAQAMTESAQIDQQSVYDNAPFEQRLDILRSLIQAQQIIVQTTEDELQRAQARKKIAEATAKIEKEKASKDAKDESARRNIMDKRKQLADAVEERDLSGMSTSEKRTYLEQKLAQQLATLDATSVSDENKILDTNLAIEGTRKQLHSLDKSPDTQVDSLREIGLSAANVNYGVDEQKKANDLLQEIRDYSKQTAEKENSTTSLATFGGRNG